MKFNFQAIVPYLIIITLLCGLTLIYFKVIRKNNLSEISRAKREARNNYQIGRYSEAFPLYQHLVDSLKIDEEPLRINYANAGFLSAATDSVSYIRMQQSRSDSTKTAPKQSEVLATTQQEYLKLTNAKMKSIGSMADNQLGIYLLKIEGSRIDNEADQTGKATDSLIRKSLLLFKEALKKDPANDSARFNYELLKLKLNFPEMVYTKAEQLVQRRRYGQAYELMESATKKDSRMKRYAEFTKKVQSIAKIDSLKRI
jgi:Ca-activated chloride channel homolog